MLKRCAVICEMYSDNLGDKAISDAMHEYLTEEKGYCVDSYDFSFRYPPTKDVKRNFVISKVRRYFYILSQLHNLYKNKYDLVVIGGGQLILENKRFFLYMLLFSLVAKISSATVKVFSVGAGSKFGWLSKLFYSCSLRIVDSICVRDKASQKVLSDLFGIRSDVVPDIVYIYAGSNAFDGDYNSGYYLVCPLDYRVYKRYKDEADVRFLDKGEYERYWIDVVISLQKQSNTDVFLAATTVDDYEFCLILKERLELICGDSVRLVNVDSWRGFCGLAKGAISVTSGRMHALIMSHNYGVKLVPFPVSDKIKSYQSEYIDYSAEKLRNSIVESNFL